MYYNANLNKITNITNANTIGGYDKLQLIDTYINAFTASIEFYFRLNSSFVDALFVPFTDATQVIKEIKKEILGDDDFLFIHSDKQQEFYKKAEKIILSEIRNKFDTNFREKSFINSLSEFIESYCNLAKTTGAGLLFQQMSNANAFWNNVYIEPIRDRMYRTPSHKIHSKNKYSLFHYYLPHENDDRQRGEREKTIDNKFSDTGLTSNPDSSADSIPLLIIYAFINRNYILDLIPNSSIIRNFQKQGFDVFMTDWGTPSSYDKELTIGHYVNDYLINAVNHIVEHSGSKKVSLLGYCWGGDLALMFSALHPEKVKNIVTFATPGDFNIDNNLLSVWTKSINADSVVDTFGNTPSVFINSSFLLRSPIDVLHKYPHFFFEGDKPKDVNSIMQFLATETWLYDSPPITGEIYRQFVNDCYKKNLFIKNEMIIGEKDKIDLSKIKQPFLNVIAKRDDLVDPESSKAINDVIGSLDKSVIEFDSGHVGVCISSRAHQQLWPKVGDWLKSR
jgi:class III poly(R)-hydroxyalkanoic acid synthase PhaC subunit